VCKLICILITASNADGFCGSSDPAVLLCSGVWGLFSLIGLIVWLRWQGDHSSGRDVSMTKLLDLRPRSDSGTAEEFLIRISPDLP
jgi:hypothetical protein